MNRDEYIAAIKNELGFLPCSEIEKAEEYFKSFFCGSHSDEEVIQSLGTPGEAARKYVKANSKPKKEPSKKPTGYTGVVIAVIVMVFLFPIWLPILIISAAIIMAVAVTAIIVSFGMWLGGGVVILSGLIAGVPLADKLIQCGIGFIMFGVGLILSWLLVKALIALSVLIIRKITRS